MQFVSFILFYKGGTLNKIPKPKAIYRFLLCYIMNQIHFNFLLSYHKNNIDYKNVLLPEQHHHLDLAF